MRKDILSPPLQWNPSYNICMPLPIFSNHFSVLPFKKCVVENYFRQNDLGNKFNRTEELLLKNNGFLHLKVHRGNLLIFLTVSIFNLDCYRLK